MLLATSYVVVQLSNEGSKSVSMTWRAIFARHHQNWPWALLTADRLSTNSHSPFNSHAPTHFTHTPNLPYRLCHSFDLEFTGLNAGPSTTFDLLDTPEERFVKVGGEHSLIQHLSNPRRLR